MPSVLTVTLNPSIDLSTSVERLAPARKLRCARERRDAGGGGLNVARVAARLGADVLAAYTSGGVVGQYLQNLVGAEGLKSLILPIAQETRENFTVLDRSSGQEYRFIVPGPELSAEEWRACIDRLSALEERFGLVVLSGSLPPGAPSEAYATLAHRAKEAGARVVLDASGAALEAALNEGVFLVKPHLDELRELLGEPLSDLASWLGACRALIERGAAEVVALTMGAEGALMVTRDGAWRAKAAPVKAVSSIGAGDSFVAAMIWALDANLALETAFRYGVAAGSAALVTPGTELCRKEDVERLVPTIDIAIA